MIHSIYLGFWSSLFGHLTKSDWIIVFGHLDQPLSTSYRVHNYRQHLTLFLRGSPKRFSSTTEVLDLSL